MTQHNTKIVEMPIRHRTVAERMAHLGIEPKPLREAKPGYLIEARISQETASKLIRLHILAVTP